MGSWQYDETDFERLSLIMMLYGLDFTVEEIIYETFFGKKWKRMFKAFK